MKNEQNEEWDCNIYKQLYLLEKEINVHLLNVLLVGKEDEFMDLVRSMKDSVKDILIFLHKLNKK